jgi:hypothetical protein
VTLGAERNLGSFHGICRIISQLSQNPSVHAVMFWVLVLAAGTFHAELSRFEIVNLSIYSRNGNGSSILEALSAYFKAFCDFLLGGGWTALPSIRLIHSTSGDSLEPSPTEYFQRVPVASARTEKSLTSYMLDCWDLACACFF